MFTEFLSEPVKFIGRKVYRENFIKTDGKVLNCKRQHIHFSLLELWFKAKAIRMASKSEDFSVNTVKDETKIRDGKKILN